MDLKKLTKSERGSLIGGQIMSLASALQDMCACDDPKCQGKPMDFKELRDRCNRIVDLIEESGGVGLTVVPIGSQH